MSALHALRLLFLCILTAILAAPPAAAAEGQQWRQREYAEGMAAGADDVSEEIRFGREVAARLLGRYGLYDNERITRYLTLLGRSLALHSSRPELTYHVAVLNTAEVNAYASPGGYIFVTRGALERVQDESELAGILAHEMMHINEKHVVKELNIRAAEGSAMSGLARIIGGGTETARIAFSQAVDKAMDMLFRTGYSREDEVQADTGAAALCALAGYDPGGLVRYFERISAAKGRNAEVLEKTHPAYDARIALIRDTMAKEGIEAGAFRANKERFAEAMKHLR